MKPVFVTGSPRSGTTWVGRMLAISPLVKYIHEPFNPHVVNAREFCDAEFKYPFTYICEDNGGTYYKPIKDMFDGKYNWKYGLLHARSIKHLKSTYNKWLDFRNLRKNGGIPLVKDPIALLSCEWLNRHFDINTIVMIRHPCAFVASMKRLGWDSHPEKWALQQEFLMRDYLGPFENEIKALLDGKHDILERASIAWKLHHYVIHQYQTKHKDWIYLRHEDISRDPLNTYETLFKRLEIPFTPIIRNSIDEYCNASNPSSATEQEKTIKLNSKAAISNWKSKLSSSEVDYIREKVEDVSKHFYTNADWELNEDSTS